MFDFLFMTLVHVGGKFWERFEMIWRRMGQSYEHIVPHILLINDRTQEIERPTNG